jgi:hypothetical protein
LSAWTVEPASSTNEIPGGLSLSANVTAPQRLVLPRLGVKFVRGTFEEFAGL